MTRQLRASQLRVKIEDKDGYVYRNEYVKAKTNQLREFGYTNLKESEVDDQIDALLSGKKFGEGLTVIGMHMEREVISVVKEKGKV